MTSLLAYTHLSKQATMFERVKKNANLHPPLGGGYSTKFYTGRLRPEVQTLTLLYTIFERKGTPSVYLSFYPFHIPTEKALK